MSTDYERTRQQLISAAAEVFAEQGFASGTTKEIARRVGLTQPAIYHYVTSKEDLLLELAKDVDARMLEILEAALAASPEPEEQLSSLIRGFVAEVAKTPHIFSVFWEELPRLPEALRTKIRLDQVEFVRTTAALVAKLQEQRILPPEGHPVVIAEAVLSMPSWMYRWYRAEGPQSPDEIADTYLSLIGIKSTVHTDHA